MPHFQMAASFTSFHHVMIRIGSCPVTRMVCPVCSAPQIGHIGVISLMMAVKPKHVAAN